MAWANFVVGRFLCWVATSSEYVDTRRFGPIVVGLNRVEAFEDIAWFSREFIVADIVLGLRGSALGHGFPAGSVVQIDDFVWIYIP
ncbi:hypothetical protein B0T26DRAFT_689079 [Lasiosphaeria miniovina]|uniref:Uncharacterized protein n=1 Tax=Lasiosphaeria miniovina TaxID=1954250 RepID=A0AA40BI10_9PEZI|nr:uncharacterized protein B0T26DRAFT_689079 [Lasiosphaeria miniovina]KAK0734612.1 hypothetical protein B0T26DRAFT_689079 [Lasiosphaeria miniovina]